MKKSEKNKVVLTIDLEDWFHSLDPATSNWANYERRLEFSTNKILDFLSETDSYATFFILGDVAQHHPNLVKQIYNDGHEIGSHGFEHKFIYKQTRNEFREDLKKSVSLLSDLIGDNVQSFRAPYFSITKRSLWAFDILKEEGIKYDSSIFPIINYRYGIPKNNRFPYQLDNEIWEWPITTIRTFLGNIPFAGGVYFRFLPSPISVFFISYLLKKQEPVLLYFHPWEFDTEQPKLHYVSPFIRFRHYYGLNKNFEKFSNVLKDFKTTAIRNGIDNFSK